MSNYRCYFPFNILPVYHNVYLLYFYSFLSNHNSADISFCGHIVQLFFLSFLPPCNPRRRKLNFQRICYRKVQLCNEVFGRTAAAANAEERREIFSIITLPPFTRPNYTEQVLRTLSRRAWLLSRSFRSLPQLAAYYAS